MPESPRAIAITGASGYLGGLLVDRLLARADVERVIDLDVRPPKREGDARLVYVEADVRRELASHVAPWRPQTIVHMAYPLQHLRSEAEIRPFSVDATRHVLDAAEACGASHVVMCSSTTVYGGHADAATPFAESSPLRPNEGYHYATGKRDVEALTLAWSAKHPDVTVTIVRPGIVLGASTDNYLPRTLLGGDKIVRGTDPALQFLHEDDFADGIARIVLQRPAGIFNLTPSDAIRRSELLAAFHLDVAEVSRDELWSELARRWEAREPDAVSPSMIDLLSYDWTADNTKLRRTVGFEPRHGSLDAAVDHFRAIRARRRTRRPTHEA